MGHCYNSTVVDASIKEVWKTMRNFHELSWASPVITKVEKVGDIDGREAGARRVLNDAFHETLVSVSETDYAFTYSIDDGPGPVAKDAVSNYLGSVQLHPVTDTGQTMVVWTSSYESDTDQAVAELCNPIYSAVLGALKSSFSG